MRQAPERDFLAWMAAAWAETLGERFQALEQDDPIEALLLELKQKQPRFR